MPSLARNSSAKITLASGDIMSAGHVTIAAVCFKKFLAYVHGVDEILDLGPGGNVLLFLADHGMAEIAIL